MGPSRLKRTRPGAFKIKFHFLHCLQSFVEGQDQSTAAVGISTKIPTPAIPWSSALDSLSPRRPRHSHQTIAIQRSNDMQYCTADGRMVQQLSGRLGRIKRGQEKTHVPTKERAIDGAFFGFLVFFGSLQRVKLDWVVSSKHVLFVDGVDLGTASITTAAISAHTFPPILGCQYRPTSPEAFPSQIGCEPRENS